LLSIRNVSYKMSYNKMDALSIWKS